MLGSQPRRAAEQAPLSSLPLLEGGHRNHGQPLRLLQPDPRAGRARARASGGQRVGFQREPLGTSVERADAAASHGPGAPAARPPPRLQLPPPPTQRGWGRGERHAGHRPRSDSRDTARPPQKPPDRHHCAPSPRPPPKAQPKEGCLLASQEFPSQGRGLALGLFLPDGPKPSPAQLLALLTVSCFRGLSECRALARRHCGHSSGQHPEVRSRPHPPDPQLHGENLRQGDSCHVKCKMPPI